MVTDIPLGTHFQIANMALLPNIWSNAPSFCLRDHGRKIQFHHGLPMELMHCLK